MEWVYIYLTLVRNVPVISVGKDNYKTEQECQLAHAGREENHSGASHVTGSM
jgi:hypothetical protein